MFDLEQSIADWRKQMLAGGVNSPQILDELESHLREETRRLTDTGLHENDAFETALQQLGKSKDLRDEFGKVHAVGFRNIFSNPWQLNLLALWFLVNGLDWLLVVPRNAFFLLNSHFTYLGFSYAISLLMGALMLPIGLGLIQRRNRWRKVALAWSGWRSAWFLFGLCFVTGARLRFLPYQPSDTPHVAYLLLRGIPTHYPLFYAPGLVILLMNTLFGLFVLTRPQISSLFRFTPEPLPRLTGKKLLAFRALEITMAILLLAPLYWFYEFQLNGIEAFGFITVLLFFWLGRVRFPQRLFSDPQDKLALGVTFGMLAVWCLVYLASLLDSPNLYLWNFTRREFWALVPFLSFIGYALAGKMADHEDALQNQHADGPNLETRIEQHV